MPHEPRLTRALRNLLQSQRVAALGTRSTDGQVVVSMVPFAIDTQQGVVVIHVSQLAAHTANMLASPQVSLLVMQAERPDESVHDLPRVTLQGNAIQLITDTPAWESARSAYLARFPEAEPMTQLGDFRFFSIIISSARHVAGFGAARTVTPEECSQILHAG